MSTMFLPMVVATAVPASTPARFSTAAIATAACGGIARVDTTVAIALGASVQPLTASNIRMAAKVKIRKPKLSVNSLPYASRGSFLPCQDTLCR